MQVACDTLLTPNKSLKLFDKLGAGITPYYGKKSSLRLSTSVDLLIDNNGLLDEATDVSKSFQIVPTI